MSQSKVDKSNALPKRAAQDNPPKENSKKRKTTPSTVKTYKKKEVAIVPLEIYNEVVRPVSSSSDLTFYKLDASGEKILTLIPLFIEVDTLKILVRHRDCFDEKLNKNWSKTLESILLKGDYYNQVVIKERPNLFLSLEDLLRFKGFIPGYDPQRLKGQRFVLQLMELIGAYEQYKKNEEQQNIPSSKENNAGEYEEEAEPDLPSFINDATGDKGGQTLPLPQEQDRAASPQTILTSSINEDLSPPLLNSLLSATSLFLTHSKDNKARSSAPLQDVPQTNSSIVNPFGFFSLAENSQGDLDTPSSTPADPGA